MSGLEILRSVNDRYQTAVAFHRESADLFCWLSLPGFAALHEYQHTEESMTQRRLKRYMIMTYQVAVPDAQPKQVNILAPLSQQKRRSAFSSGDRMKATKVAWDAYRDWETDTLKDYEEAAKELMETGCMADYAFMAGIVRDVSEELAFLSDVIYAMEGIEMDMPTITSMQLEMQEKWQKKLRNLYKDME